MPYLIGMKKGEENLYALSLSNDEKDALIESLDTAYQDIISRNEEISPEDADNVGDILCGKTVQEIKAHKLIVGVMGNTTYLQAVNTKKISNEEFYCLSRQSRVIKFY